MRRSAKENTTLESIENTLQILEIAKNMLEQLISTHLDNNSGKLIMNYFIKVSAESIENQDATAEYILNRVKNSLAFLNLSKQMYLEDDYVLSHIEMARELWTSLHAEKSHFYCK